VLCTDFLHDESFSRKSIKIDLFHVKWKLYDADTI